MVYFAPNSWAGPNPPLAGPARAPRRPTREQDCSLPVAFPNPTRPVFQSPFQAQKPLLRHNKPFEAHPSPTHEVFHQAPLPIPKRTALLQVLKPLPTSPSPFPQPPTIPEAAPYQPPTSPLPAPYQPPTSPQPALPIPTQPVFLRGAEVFERRPGRPAHQEGRGVRLAALLKSFIQKPRGPRPTPRQDGLSGIAPGRRRYAVFAVRWKPWLRQPTSLSSAPTGRRKPSDHRVFQGGDEGRNRDPETTQGAGNNR